MNLIHKGDYVLDLGCSPGSWLLYAASLTGASGKVTGIDLKPVSISLPPHAQIVIADMLDLSSEQSLTVFEKFNVILSDMAPSTTGNKHVDAVRSFNLCQAALSVAQNWLLPGGSFVCKIFQGEDFSRFIHQVKLLFQISRIFKPESCRKASREIYVIGTNKH